MTDRAPEGLSVTRCFATVLRLAFGPYLAAFYGDKIYDRREYEDAMAADNKIWIIDMGDVMETAEDTSAVSPFQAGPRQRSTTRPSVVDAIASSGQTAPPRPPQPRSSQPRPAQAPIAQRQARQQQPPPQQRPAPQTPTQQHLGRQQSVRPDAAVQAERTAYVKHPIEQRPTGPTKPPSRATKTNSPHRSQRPHHTSFRHNNNGSAPNPKSAPGHHGGLRLSPGRLVLMTYLLGPLSILATAAGRRQRLWTAASLVVLVAGVVLALSERHLLGDARNGGLLLIWLLAAAITTLLGSAVWARALAVTGRTFRTARFGRLPSWCREPWSAGALSLLLPGAGYFLLGRMRRAIVALALVGPVVLSLLVVLHASRMWHWHQSAVESALSGSALEWLFLGAGLILALGLVMWFVQVLDAVGTAAIARTLAYGGRRRLRSDWIAGALVATLVAAVFLFQPAQLAGRLDGFATALRQEGLQVIPLNLAEAAMTLDPSQPRYAVQVAEICSELGRQDRAEQLREQLDQRWHTYATLARQAATPPSPASSQAPADAN